MPLNATFTGSRSLPVAAKDGGGFQSAGLVSAPGGTFTPLIADDFLSGTAGNTVTTAPSSTWYENRCLYDTTRAFSGGQSMKILMSSSDGQSCGAMHSYGGDVTFPVPVPSGKNIWLRYKMYIPATFSWGYVYDSGDAAAAAACGNFSDGNGRHKFIYFGNNANNSKKYLQPYGSRRSVARVAGLAIDGDGGPFGFLDNSFLWPVDQWVDIQVQTFVDSTNGFMRVWVDGVYKGQINGSTVPSGASVSKVGIGNYWNGVHYTDGQAGRSEFWVDEMIVASDIGGYGAPNGTDSGGRPFIDPATLIGDL